jgi:serine/threonine protein kinase
VGRQDFGFIGRIFMEWVAGGSLGHVLRTLDKGRLPEKHLNLYLKQLLKGVEYLHWNGIIHRDIKPDNILTHEGNIKLSDFGTSRECAAGRFETCTPTGTPAFLAPECINSDLYSTHSDIWAVGCTALNLFTGTHPWSQPLPTPPGGHNVSLQCRISHLVSGEHYPPELQLAEGMGASARFIEFVRKTLAFEPSQRSTATELLQDPFFA